MDEQRPDPDAILARLRADENRERRGKLKIFFGATAGVGKTYSMLDAAHMRQAEGIDVVVGYIEPHGRAETEALLHGLEAIPSRLVDYQGAALREFDLDAAIARHPQLILVDELAHTNAPGMRHPKRYQDVEELLAAGINVYTTVNVQHLESLTDIVSQITGVVVRETIPDSLLEQADEVEMVDLAPDDLLQRLKEGKVYVPGQAERAMQNFFRKGNLMALRELALRRTADRVDEQMQDYRRDHAVKQTWPAAERILVSISPSPLSRRLVRAAKRMASGLRAEWLAVYIETPSHARLPEKDRDRAIQTLRLAEQLGAETAIRFGHNVSQELLAYAHERNVSKIIVGKPSHPRWRDIVFGSVLDELVRHSEKIDIYVISGDPDPARSTLPIQMLRRTSGWRAYANTLLVFVLCTLLARLMLPYFDLANLIMVYLVGVVFAAARYGRGPSMLAALLSVLAFDFFFVTPYLTFAVSDSQYIVTFIIMLLVGMTISTLTVRIKQQAEAARERERHTANLYAMSRDLANSQGTATLAAIAAQHISEVFDSRAVVVLPDAQGNLSIHVPESAAGLTVHEQGVARWVYDHGQAAGLGTQALPGAQGLYLPLRTLQGTAGVIGIFPNQAQRLFSPDQMHLVETFANQTSLAVERAQLAEEAEQAHMQIETERLRNSLLSSVSHDLRTPLAVITGAASSLLENDATLTPESRHELAQVTYEEAERLNRLVSNLLDMTRLQSGGIHVNKEWQLLEEVIGATLNRLEKRLAGRSVSVTLPDDLPLVPFDSTLIDQVLVNLLDNAVKYTPPGSPIDLSARRIEGGVLVEIADHGPGLRAGDEQRIFDKFYRAQPAATRGAGLGLAICRGIVEIHGGRIWAENRPDGGAVFRFTLPLDGEPPEVVTDDE
ncbi:sensor histidine kinase [Aggregatilinea lenta]|uniref:sensor histidine kinase n=1 Tax=Aggregatilinea lenta TaxID=913108 RepID=UPI000E5BC570|nr:sensor histidine kinase KdpD [Aggregatilinea lenta]